MFFRQFLQETAKVQMKHWFSFMQIKKRVFLTV